MAENMNWKKVTRENRVTEPLLNFDKYHQKTGRLLDFIDKLKGVRTNSKWSTWGRWYVEVPKDVLQEFGIVSNTNLVVYMNSVFMKACRYCYAGNIFEGDAAWFDEYKDLSQVEILRSSAFQVISDALENTDLSLSFKSFFHNSRNKWREVPISNPELVSYAEKYNTDLHQINVDGPSSDEKYLFIDTETTGLPIDYHATYKDLENWPNIVQIAWVLTDSKGNTIEQKEALLKPNRVRSFEEGLSVHGISIEESKEKGKEIIDVLNQLEESIKLSNYIVGHNIHFDYNIIAAEMERYGINSEIHEIEQKCTMILGKHIYNRSFSNYPKFPKLSELYKSLFGEPLHNAHNAMADTIATKNCFWELKKLGA